MDRVEVARGARIAHQIGTSEADQQRGQLIANGDIGATAPVYGPAHGPVPRTTSMARAVVTGPPALSMISQRRATMSLPPIVRMLSTYSVAASSSPAVIGRWWVKDWLPCTILW